MHNFCFGWPVPSFAPKPSSCGIIEHGITIKGKISIELAYLFSDAPKIIVLQFLSVPSVSTFFTHSYWHYQNTQAPAHVCIARFALEGKQGIIKDTLKNCFHLHYCLMVISFQKIISHGLSSPLFLF